jgi:hypothetical protein
MKKVLATTIAIVSIAVLLFFATACFGINSSKFVGDILENIGIKRASKEVENSKEVDSNKEPVKEVIEDKSEEELEKDPEESITDGESVAGDEDSSTNIETIEVSQEDIFALIPMYPNIEELQNEIYDHDNKKYSLFAFTDDAPDAVYNWYKDESESIGWEIWKDEGGALIANYGDFRLVLTVVLIESNYYPNTRITMNVR